MKTQAKKNEATEFDKLYKVLNKEQKEAVDAIEGPVMVIAGPGTGKTTVLTLRIANILKRTDTAPENILALTFTESGAFAMRKKLVTIVGPAAYKVNIHTFHGFAEEIIQTYPDYFPRVIGSSVITDAEQIKFIRKIIESPEIKILRPYGNPTHYISSILHEIQILKRENISPAELAKSVQKDSQIDGELKESEKEKIQKRNEKNRELSFVYKKYEEELARLKYYDFEDMLLELVRAVEKNKAFKLILQETYQYILADEHQDANMAQNRILELLADFHDSPNLFIVGDDKQAIYRFQGASLDNFLYFSKKYKDAVIIDLEHNYRSHQGILDASHSLIANNPSVPGRKLTKLVSLQVGTSPIFIKEYATAEDEVYHVSTEIERLIKEGEQPEEIAVLYRENKEAKAISDSLSRRGIKHRIESDYNILDAIDSVKTVILAKAIFDPSNDESLAKALLLPELGCDRAKVMELFGKSQRLRQSLHVLLEEENKKSSVRCAYERILSWAGLAEVMPCTDLLQKVIQETGLIADIAASSDSLERLASLHTFYEKILDVAKSKKTFYLSDFMEYIDVVSEHGLMVRRSFTEHVGGVRLMTAHRSKGLEFNHVFILNVVDGVWGNRSKRSQWNIPVIEHARDTGRLEDERRLFYVAMTRARESIYLSYSRSEGGSENLPSQFLTEIDLELVNFVKIDSEKKHTAFVEAFLKPSTPARTSILDQSFVKSKFLSQPFSVTHLNNYLKCPWTYFFVNLVRVPQAPSKHQMYGTAVHAALKSFFDSYKEGRAMSKEKLLNLFKHNLEKQPMSLDDKKDSMEKGTDSLGGYFDEYNGTWNRNLMTEVVIKGVELTADKDIKIELTGKLDKIEILQGSRVAVVDYKTSKPKSRNEMEGLTKGSDGNYKRQLVFYKLLLDEAKKYDMEYGVIDFVEPNTRSIYKREQFMISGSEVQELKRVIETVAHGIMDLSFIDSKCEEKDCEYCRLGAVLRGSTSLRSNL